MYYKITNKECKEYKELYELRVKEKEIEKKNHKAVSNMVGNDYDEFLGHMGQQNFWRTTQYSGFKFNHPENLPPKTWKQHKEYKEYYVPDRRTKNGRKIKEFLNTLDHSSIIPVFKILKCELCGRFAFPFVEIGKDDVIVFFMSERYRETLAKNKNFIEITSVEFEQIINY